MKKRNLLMLSSVLLLGGISIVSLNSCGSNETVVQKSTVKITVNDSALGTVTADKESYDVDEQVNLTITPSKNCVLESLTINGNKVDLSIRNFKAKEGENTVEAIFVKTVKTIAEVRLAATSENTLVTINGVVTKVIWNNSKTFVAGFYISDDTDSMYVHLSKESTIKTVDEGDVYTLKGNAYVYKDSSGFDLIQMKDPTLVEKEETKSEFNEKIVTNSSIEEINSFDTSKSKDYVGKLYSADCKIVLSNATYNNFSFYSTDESVSLPSYAQWSGTYENLKEFDGQFKNVTFIIHSPKKSGDRSWYRLIPVKINGDYTPSASDNLYKSIDAADDFGRKYFYDTKVELLSADPEVPTNIFTYESSNKEVATIVEENSKTYLNILGKNGKTNITITVKDTLTNKTATSDPIEINVLTETPTGTITSLADIRTNKVEDKSTVLIKGVVLGGAYANGGDGEHFNAYYIMDNTDVMLVYLDDSEWKDITLEKGHEVYIEGTKDHYKSSDGKSGSLTLKKGFIKDLSKNTVELSQTIEKKKFEEIYDFKADLDANLTGKVYYTDVLITGEVNQGSGKFQYYIEEINPTNPAEVAKKNVYPAPSNNLDSFLRPYLDKKVTCLIGLHDIKNNHYRFDVIPGYFTAL